MSHFFDGTWRLKTMNLILKKGTYYACFSMTQEVNAAAIENIQQIVGIDLVINFLSVSYDGQKTPFVKGREIKDRRAKYKRLRKNFKKNRRLLHAGS